MKYYLAILVVIVTFLDILTYQMLGLGYKLTLWPIYGMNIIVALILLISFIYREKKQLDEEYADITDD